VIALALLATLGAPDTVIGDALAPYRGQPVLSVDLEAPEDENVDELRSLVDIYPGYLLSTDAVQAALKRLYALGRFSDVGVTAERLSGTVSLHFYVSALRRLEWLEIESTDQSDEDELRAALGLEPGDEVDSRTAVTLQRRAVTHLLRAGFPDVEVEVEQTSKAESQRVSFIVHVREGEPIRVAAVRFVGRPRAEPNILRRLVRTQSGGILNLATVADDAKKLQAAYRERGFLEAEFEPPKIAVRDGGAVVTFAVQAGDRIRVEVYGNRRLTRNDLLALWPAVHGRLQATDLAVFSQRIKDSYQRLGHLNAKVELRTIREVAEELTRHLVRVTEGPQVRVTSLEFVGAKAFHPKLLQAQIRSLLRRQLESDQFLQRLRPSDYCLAEPRGLSNQSDPTRSCERPDVPAEQRWIPALYEDALEEITAAYRDLGFLTARVGPAEITTDQDEIHVRIPINEGPQAIISSVSFRGNEELTAGELLTAVEGASSGEGAPVPQRPGGPYSASGIEDARIEILRRYRDRGYLYATAFAEVKVSDDGKQANVVFAFEEGPQVHIERILVRGNRHTLDGLIRSRLTMEPGDLYRLEQALADQRSIAGLGVFSSVRVKIIDEEKPAERKDVVAEVVERPRSAVDLRGGLSTADGVRVGVGYLHRNVLGTASKFDASANINRQLFFALYGEFGQIMLERYDSFSTVDQIEREIRVGIQSPRLKQVLFDPLARIDLVHERENAISYSLDSVSAILSLDFAPTEHITFAIGPEISFTNNDCILEGAVGGDKECAEVEQRPTGGRPLIVAGSRRTVSVVPSLTFDFRDNPFNPTTGYYANIKGEYATGRRTPPDSTEANKFSFMKVEGVLSGYLPAKGLVLAASARAGVTALLDGIDIPIDERFFLGGRSTLRGFAEGGTLIPEDACVLYSDPEDAEPCQTAGETPIYRTAESPPVTPGGRFYILFKLEARVPLTMFSENLSTGLFVDFGNLWIGVPSIRDLAFRVGVGGGIRYATPVGPLALDIGVNTDPNLDAGELSPVLHFSVGVF